MIIETYTQWFSKDEAYRGWDAGWYAVQVTDCDTIICGEYDGHGGEIPFPTRDDAEFYRKSLRR